MELLILALPYVPLLLCPLIAKINDVWRNMSVVLLFGLTVLSILVLFPPLNQLIVIFSKECVKEFGNVTSGSLFCPKYLAISFLLFPLFYFLEACFLMNLFINKAEKPVD